MIRIGIISGIICSAFLASAAQAAPPVAATPATLTAILVSAKPGDRLTLSGSFDRITIKGRAFAPPLTIDASAATVRGLTLDGVTGVNWTGGAVTGNGTTDFTSSTGYGVSITNSARVTIARINVTGWGRGIVVGSSTDIAVTGSWLHGLRSDGIDVALSQRVAITGNALTDFAPNPAYTDAAGVWHDGDHPDAIQAWSRPGGISSDLTITGNLIVGVMQGISLFNHPERLPVGDPGFDRVTVTGNVIRTSSPLGLSVWDCRACTVTGNDVQSLAGARYKAQANFGRSTGTACANVVADVPKAALAVACR